MKNSPHEAAARAADYYDTQYNALAMVPDHPRIAGRWMSDSARVRRTNAGIFDIAYGDAPGERLDFFPANGGGAPLLVYIHGGWWRSRDKSDFSFVAPAYTRAGINVALTNYSLAPSATIEEIVLQQLRALAWLYRHADNYDFDRERIVVAGHSAGGHLAAMCMAAVWPVFGADLPAGLVKAGVLLSGLYDLEPVRHAQFVNADLRLTPERVARLSPALLPQSHPAPYLTAVGGLESEEFRRQNDLIRATWPGTHRGDIALPDANYLTIVDAFADPEGALHAAVRELVAGTTRA